MKAPFLKTVLMLMILVLLVSGCISAAPKEEAGAKQEILISCSGSGVEILKPLADAFVKKNPEITIRFLAPTSTGDGIVGAGEGTLDIASIARKMKDSEKSKYPNLAEATYVRDAMILAVNPKLNITGLTSGQVRGIHAGNITDWSQVGAQSGAIMLLDREESESSKLVLRKEILGPNLTITQKAVVLYSAGTTHETIAKEEFAIGQASLGAIKMQKYGIKPLAIDGVVPAPDTVKSGQYKMVRDYGVAYNKDGASEATKKFIDFIFSSGSAQILAGYDFVPVPRTYY